jgi:eukaryotic-like serine/threonine-protein kinase
MGRSGSGGRRLSDRACAARCRLARRTLGAGGRRVTLIKSVGDRAQGQGDWAGPDRFELVEQLGAGGMGVVYEVYDRELGARVALKGLKSLRAESVLRFKNEFRTLRDLKHPNLISLGELIEDRGHWYFTMELVDGAQLFDYLAAAIHTSGSGVFASNKSVVGTAQSSDLAVSDRSAAATMTAAKLDGTRVTRTSGALRSPAPLSVADLSPAGRDEPVAVRPLDDESRIRDVLAQLATAVAFLHQSGTVHRDIKPSNVMVDRNDRVVLLDFGVAAELADEELTRERVGTLAYMAPEQARGEPAGPAADWYAVGVLLFELLTGRVPFVGSGREGLLLAKLHFDAPRLDVATAGCCADLAELANRLLARDPTQRPGEAEILAVLHGGGSNPWLPVSLASGTSEVPLVGRAYELAELDRAYRDSRAGEAIAVFIEGPSGLGKSATADEFVRRLRRTERRTLILRGRCHEKESIPYNAFDGVVDELARYLRKRPARAERVGKGLSLVARIFPVAGAIAETVAADESAGSPVDPTEVRRAAFQELRRLLTVLARDSLVLVVDDVQWIDRDSLLLLEELMRPPAAPPLLLVATVRAEAGAGPCAAAAVAGAEVRRIALAPLSEDAAQQLVRELIDRHGGDEAAIDFPAVTASAGRHPMFIEEILRHVMAEGTAAVADLDQALLARVGRLPDETRRLVELVAVAGNPLSHDTVADAAGMLANSYTEHMERLRAGRLVRISGARARDHIEPYHDRVREAVYWGLAESERTDYHQRLAIALDQRGAAAEVLAGHWALGGQAARAAACYEAAGEGALSTLAFEKAAEYFANALRWGTAQADERRRLLRRQAGALHYAGRPRDAAEIYCEAASAGTPEPEEHRELIRLATEQYLTGGYLVEGTAMAAELMRSLGTSLPRTRTAAYVRLAFHILVLRLRPLGRVRTNGSALSSDVAARLDAFWTLSAGFAFLDTVRALLFTALGATGSIRTGDPLRIARALTAVAVSEAIMGNRRSAERYAVACDRAGAEGGALPRFFAVGTRAMLDYVLEARYEVCRARIAEARTLWQTVGRERGFELDSLEQFDCWSLEQLGRWSELRCRVAERVQAARDAGNRFVEIAYLAWFVSPYAAADQVEQARANVAEARAIRMTTGDEFSNDELYAVSSLTYLALYAGDVERWAEELGTEWNRFRRAMASRVPYFSATSAAFELGLELELAARARRTGQASVARRHAGRAARAVHRARGFRFGFMPGRSAAMAATLARYHGDDAAAVASLRQAIHCFDGQKSQGKAACVRQLLGGLLGGSEGADLIAQASDWMTSAGICKPEQFVRAEIPGWIDAP